MYRTCLVGEVLACFITVLCFARVSVAFNIDKVVIYLWLVYSVGEESIEIISMIIKDDDGIFSCCYMR